MGWETPPGPSLLEWQRACERSAREARERRQRQRTGPWPTSWRVWLGALVVAGALLAAGILAREAQASEYALQLRGAPAPGVHLTAPAHHRRAHR